MVLNIFWEVIITKNQIEEKIIQEMKQKHVDRISLEECMKGKSKDEIMRILGTIKYFKKLKRTYVSSVLGIVTYFEK